MCKSFQEIKSPFFFIAGLVTEKKSGFSDGNHYAHRIAVKFTHISTRSATQIKSRQQ